MRRDSRILGLTVIAGLIILFTACSENPDETGGPAMIPNDGSDINALMEKECDFSAVLTEDEISGLLYMREEEKLARDIYLVFSEMYNIPIFRNIAVSEQRHMDAVLFLINGYGLADPVADKEIGQFTEAFQDIYNELYALGSENLKEAYEVGVIIEETDIEDITKFLSETEVTNIVTVYTYLLNGSANHLKAFQEKL